MGYLRKKLRIFKHQFYNLHLFAFLLPHAGKTQYTTPTHTPTHTYRRNILQHEGTQHGFPAFLSVEHIKYLTKSPLRILIGTFSSTRSVGFVAVLSWLVSKVGFTSSLHSYFTHITHSGTWVWPRRCQ